MNTQHIISIFTVITFVIFANISCDSVQASLEGEALVPGKRYSGKVLKNKILSYSDRKIVSYETMLNHLNNSRVIFLGEFHNSVPTHEYQLRIIQDIYKKHRQIAIAMEMFERDTQAVLNKFLSGNLSHKMFLKKSRPWSNYLSDYKPIIDFAKAHGLDVLAMNTPRFLIRKVVSKGNKYILSLKGKKRGYLARKVRLKDKKYRDFFQKLLPQGHHFSKKQKTMYQRFLLASMVKDSTMAESIARYLKKPRHKGHKLFSINGKFHSDYGIAIPSRLKRRIPGIRIAIVSFIPLRDKDSLDLSRYLGKNKQADFLVFTDDKRSFVPTFHKSSSKKS
ncbi:MAG: ChaN family lipoprotein [Spirochaetota bacterium]|nr:ChaN family lipoprotein [Spirochaetota bacterium]